MNQVIFLCRRNICSSRVAAALFNHVVKGRPLHLDPMGGDDISSGRMSPNRILPGWKAISRGLEVDLNDQGFISPNAIEYLEHQAVEVEKQRLALSVEPSDLLWSDRIVALHEPEHRPIIENRFAFWANRMEYWEVPDFHESNWGKALPRLEANVLELVAVIRSSEKIASY